MRSYITLKRGRQLFCSGKEQLSEWRQMDKGYLAPPTPPFMHKIAVLLMSIVSWKVQMGIWNIKTISPKWQVWSGFLTSALLCINMGKMKCHSLFIRTYSQSQFSLQYSWTWYELPGYKQILFHRPWLSSFELLSSHPVLHLKIVNMNHIM